MGLPKEVIFIGCSSRKETCRITKDIWCRDERKESGTGGVESRMRGAGKGGLNILGRKRN